MSHSFDVAVERILSKNTLFKKEAYYFLNEALGKALKTQATKNNSQNPEHVNAATLCLAFRDLALDQYGGLAKQVLNHWGLQVSQDIGKMVYALVDDGVWSKTEEDTLEDFNDVIDFDAVFLKPFISTTSFKGPGIDSTASQSTVNTHIKPLKEAKQKKASGSSKALPSKKVAPKASQLEKTRKQPAPTKTQKPKKAAQTAAKNLKKKTQPAAKRPKPKN